MQVRDIMTPNPFTIDSGKPVYEALLLMYEHDIRRLPVIDSGRLVGIISDRDIKQMMGRPSLAAKKDSQPEAELKLSVAEVMSHEVVTIEDKEDVREAIELIVENKFSGLPVVDRDQKLVGVVSAIDLLRYALDLIDQAKGK
jgi:acetoin utilization protein AcuB